MTRKLPPPPPDDRDLSPRRLRILAGSYRERAEALLRMAAAAEAHAAELERVGAAASLQNRPKAGKLDDMLGQDSRALKIAKARTARGRPAIVQALYDVGLTPKAAADYLTSKGFPVSRDVLKQAWARGDQFRPAKPEWRKALAKRPEGGVPESLWPDAPLA